MTTRTRWPILWTVLSLVLAALGCGGRGHFAPAAAPADSSFTLRPGDVVRLRIWREPDFSGDFQIGEDGNVVLPKLGAVRAVGETPKSLRTALVRAYSVDLKNPAIDVDALRRITILGAVARPGIYTVDATMNVADVLAQAGGGGPAAKTDRVDIIRDGSRLRQNVTGHTRLSELPLRSGDQLFVPERSWLSRNTAAVASVSAAALGLLITVASTRR